MTSKLYVQKRGPSGGTDIDLTAFTGRKGVPFFDESNASLIQLGHRAFNAQSSQGTFRLMDPDAELAAADFSFNLPAHALVTWTEDAPGAEVWLSRGRIAQVDGGRGVVKVDDEVDFDVTVDDGNSDLRGQAFTESWVRPAETDVARLIALQAYTLNGGSSTADHFRDTCAITVSASHLAPNSNTVTMPAKKYLPGTQPADVVQDCADTAGKQYAVVIHHTGGSHLCLLYVINSDHSTYASVGKISDHDADWDPEDGSAPVWEPHWEAGRATLYDGQSLLSGMVGVWQPETGIFVEYADNDESYDYWVDPYHDSVSTTSGQAADRTAGILEERRLTTVSHRVSVILLADQVDMVAAGMSIQIKAAAALGGQYLDAYQTRRIAECQFEPRLDGRYWAHLNLDRPTLRVAPGKGKASSAPPQAPVVSEPSSAVVDYLWDDFPAPDGLDDTTGTITSGPHAGDFPGSIYSTSLDASCGSAGIPLSDGDYHFRAIYRSNDAAEQKGVELIQNGGGTIDQTTLTGAATLEDGFDFTISGSMSPVQFRTYGPSSGHRAAIYLAEISHGSSSAFIGTPPPPPATDGSGTIGTPGTYATSDHAHPVQQASVTPIDDAGDYFASSNVEDALQELGGIAGADHFHPTAFGAVGDGATDDTSAIQDALDAAAVAGGVVCGQRLTYLISGSPALTITDNSRIAIRDITFKFGANVVALKISALAGGGAHGVLIDNAYFWSTSTTGTTAIYLEDQDRVTVRASRIDACAIGIDFHPSSEWVEGTGLSDVWITDCTTGIRFFGSGGTHSFMETSFRNVGVNNCATGIDIQAQSQMYGSDWVNVTVWPDTGGTGVKIDGDMTSFRASIGFDGAAGSGTLTAFSIGANATNLGQADIWSRFTGTFTEVGGVGAAAFKYRIGVDSHWEPVTDNPGGGPELVWDGDDLVMQWVI